MRIISWNVNGLRAILKKDFLANVALMRPDILCLQEIKVTPELIPQFEIERFSKFYNTAVRKGYSGTAIFTNILPKNVNTKTSIDAELEPQEGRVIVAEYDDFFLITVYTPNSGAELNRLQFRAQIWDMKFSKFLRTLDKPIILCGDLNVAREEIDVEHPESNHFSAGFTDVERFGINNLIKENDLIDTFRYFYPNLAQAYSWWSYRAMSRARNVGWRIDYVLVSRSLIDRVRSAFICKDVLGSDHAPVGIDLN